MDRFKTKIWDKDNKIMHTEYSSEFVIDLNGNIYCVDNWDDGHGEISPWHKKNLIRVQCTGLKLATGQLLFEGDIINNDPECPESKGEIVFHKGAFQYSFIFEGRIIYVSIDDITLKCSRVIGNIYENPDLICKDQS